VLLNQLAPKAPVPVLACVRELIAALFAVDGGADDVTTQVPEFQLAETKSLYCGVCMPGTWIVLRNRWGEGGGGLRVISCHIDPPVFLRRYMCQVVPLVFALCVFDCKRKACIARACCGADVHVDDPHVGNHHL
jgi:hypothetical protein